jgi:hypothetical protein
MPKVIQMPRRSQPENEGHPIHRSMILADPTEESESLSKIQRWLEMGDLALGEKKISLKQRPA